MSSGDFLSATSVTCALPAERCQVINQNSLALLTVSTCCSVQTLVREKNFTGISLSHQTPSTSIALQLPTTDSHQSASNTVVASLTSLTRIYIQGAWLLFTRRRLLMPSSNIEDLKNLFQLHVGIKSISPFSIM